MECRRVLFRSEHAVLSNTGIPCALAGVAAARLPIDTAAKKSCFIVSLLSAWAPAPVKFRQPELRIIAQFGNHFAGHARCLRAPRQHGEFIVPATEIPIGRTTSREKGCK